MKQVTRTETDLLGTRELPADAYWGIHSLRASENFPIAKQAIHPELIAAYGLVKLASAKTNRKLGVWEDESKAEAIEQACTEVSEGRFNASVIVDRLQGGAGTSTNMNVNEVIANRALELLDEPLGNYEVVSPSEDINLHQSTNDTYPSALRLAAIKLIGELEEEIVRLQESFQEKEKQFAHVVKVGRTQLQDAVLTTLGRSFSAYAEALSRDRWRVYKCQERLRVLSLGGTAIGTGLGAPREYIFQVIDVLRELTGVGFARGENLVDSVQNADVFVEVSGILKALACTLLKTATDLRLLSSGPQAGLGEINLPSLQAGSSIMPGKINPVIPEAISQTAIEVMANDQIIAMASSQGTLELNQFLPLIADSLLSSLKLLCRSCRVFREHCIDGITANEEVCRRHVHGGTAQATALLSRLGYEELSRLVGQAEKEKISLRELILKESILTKADYEELTSAEAVCRLGAPDLHKKAKKGK